MTLVGTIRFLVGAGLLAAGGTLVAPLAVRLADAVRETTSATLAPAPVGGAVAPVGLMPPTPPGQVPPLSVAEPAGASTVESPGPFPDVAASPAGGDWLQLDRAPPQPPAPLPPPPQELARANPAMGAAYRSTLDVPPPPLLDAAAPPPAATWPVVVAAASAPVATPLAEITVPAAYRVRDGDDLGSIAGHFYGHPSAAPAIWAANRETIPDPDLLPIGVELRLPPPWAVDGRRRTTTGAIEPVAHVRPSAPDASVAPAAATPWLAPVPATPVSAPVTPPGPAAATRAVAAVVIGPGETLPSLARRLYGDPAMAEAIFAANRDRLRSPDLVVPGMQLRLPRPVTAAVP